MSSKLKEQILELRQQGKSYSEIRKALGCSNGTISFHCSKDVRTRALFRQKCNRNNIEFESLRPRHTEKITVKCLNCETDLGRGIYCNLTCQAEHRFNLKYDAWLTGVTQSCRRWLRKALSKLHGYKCYECGVSEWNSKSIVLEVEHKDGNSENDEISNLALICPNCHSQTSTYKGANKGNGRHYRRVRYAEGKSY